jgi:hypothetical protein
MGQAKKKVKNYQKMAAFGYPVLLITDLDSAECPPSLHRTWMDTIPHEMFLFRVAVREVEAWLLADRDALAGFLKIKITRIPDKPEELDDPKRILLNLARLAPRRIRNGLLPEPRSKAHIGPEYNDLLTDYVRSSWDIETAADRAPSLRKALSATKFLASKFKS